MPTTSPLSIKGARVHNLRNVSLEVPRNSFVVFTGVSGSGKSSLAFDTIFAEGQRRYVESLSSYARMFLDKVDRPDVDAIEGLSPAVAIDQKSTNRNPRSTVGTITEIWDHLRLLWARIGVPHCPVCNAAIGRQTVQQIADQLMELPAGTRFQLLAPVISQQKGEHAEVLQSLRASGYSRVVINGEMASLNENVVLDKKRKHDIAVVVDRMKAGEGILKRLTDSLETALKLAHGVVAVEFVDAEGPARHRTFSEHLSCPNLHPVELSEIEPRTFSFNAPFGACAACSGLGIRNAVDLDLLLGDPELSLAEGVLLPWAQAGSGQSRYFEGIISGLADRLGFKMTTPWGDLSEDVRQTLLHGDGAEVRVHRHTRHGRDLSYNTTYEGIVTYVERKHAEAETDTQRARWARYLRDLPCDSCKGARLKPSVLAVRINGKSIVDLADLSLADAALFFAKLSLTQQQAAISKQVITEITSRLTFLLDVGLHYLTLTRTAGSLSGGEAQRIRLATQVGAGLTGVLYVLDEPSIGLHQRDNDRLIASLVRLKDLGNSLIVVEHDEDTIRAADWVVDVGPGAGETGGTIVHNGPLSDLLPNKQSVTADYLSGRRAIAGPGKRRPVDPTRSLKITGARANNLRSVDVEIPLGVFVAVTGVSGSGKSSLVNEILHKVLANKLNGATHVPGKHTRVTGLEYLEKVVHVDQSPIGRTPRSNPATYTGVFDKIRALFADTVESKVRGYTAARFSFNVKGGRCEPCRGEGTVKIEMNFLPDVFVPCEVCSGTRFNRETLQIHYKGKSIADVLDMPIREAAEFFGAFSIIARFIRALDDVGLGYMRLGQSATTLSGGESQRVKLATELQRRSRGRTIYVLDEPTSGLHFEDVDKLLKVLHGLVDKGNTVLTIEHNLDVIKTADWLIDIGPEGGTGGGMVVAEGSPESVRQHPGSWTGRFLAPVLAQSGSTRIP